MKTHKQARELCMSYAPIEVGARYYYSEQQVLSMLQEIYEDK